MSILGPNTQTIVTHLRVHGAGLDPLLARLRLTSLLDAAALHPAGLAPSAIVCIRALRDPLPGALQVRGGARPPVAWERAVAASLDALVRRAARPSLGAVPANADAVLFADRAELLACLALDWLAGQAATRWWWRSLFRGADIAKVVAPLWLDTPEYIPAALAHMAEQGSAAHFARRLSDGEARALLRGITGSFGLPALQAALDTPLEDGTALEQGAEPALQALQRDSTPAAGGGSFQSQVMEAPSPPFQRDRQPARSEAPPSAPWRRWVPESGAGALGIEQQCLLGVGLLLQRAPAVARAPSFVPAVARWRSAAPAIEQERRHAMTATSPPQLIPDPSNSWLSVPNSPPKPGAATPTDRAATTTPTTQISGSLTGEPPAACSAQPGLAIAADDEAPLDAWPEPAIGSSIGAPPLDAPTEAPRPIEARITTELGGLFYLLNLGLFLNLYGDFTSPATAGIALPIWDFVTLVGRWLLAANLRMTRPGRCWLGWLGASWTRRPERASCRRMRGACRPIGWPHSPTRLATSTSPRTAGCAYATRKAFCCSTSRSTPQIPRDN